MMTHLRRVDTESSSSALATREFNRFSKALDSFSAFEPYLAIYLAATDVEDNLKITVTPPEVLKLDLVVKITVPDHEKGDFSRTVLQFSERQSFRQGNITGVTESTFTLT